MKSDVNEDKSLLPLISVMIPVYNVERYLPECIDSILRQTYTHFELILVDDGSTDSSGEICRSYAEKDSRIRYVRQENGGVSVARNKGLEFAQGEWIAFADSDDWMEPNQYEVLMQTALETDAEIAACGVSHEFKNLKYYMGDTGELKILQGKNELMEGYGEDYFTEMGSKIFRRSLIFDNGFSFPAGKKHEDIDLIYFTYRHCKKMACIKKPLYHYRQRKGSIVHSLDIKAGIDFWEIRKEAFDALEAELTEKQRRKMIYDCCMSSNRIWSSAAKTPRSKRKTYGEKLSIIAKENRRLYPEVRRGNYSAYVKLISLVTCHPNGFSYSLLFLMNAVYGKFLKKNPYSKGELFE